MLKALNVDQQIQEAEDRALDDRPRIKTGWSEFDGLLSRGGFERGTLGILGGRTRTRKTTITSNLIVNMLELGTPVGFIGLDEPTASYMMKLLSAHSGVSAEQIETEWDSMGAENIRKEFRRIADGKLVLSKGFRPDREHLEAWLDTAAVGNERPEIIFIDYISLLFRNEYAGAEVQRVQRVIEELQVFASAKEVCVVALHQVGRFDENSSRRYHGDTPLTLESLKYAGEEVADYVLGSFRPSLDPIGNMTLEQAQQDMKDKFDEEEWEEARARVERNRDYTYIQLLKNRPGTRTNEQGIKIKSLSDSQKMKTMSQLVENGMVMQ